MIKMQKHEDNSFYASKSDQVRRSLFLEFRKKDEKKYFEKVLGINLKKKNQNAFWLITS